MILSAFDLAAPTFILFAILGADATDTSPSRNIIGPEWIATHFYDGQSLAPVTTAKFSHPSLQFDEDGIFSGRTGCNNFSAFYSGLTETSIHFDGIRRITRAACRGEDLWRQERAFLGLFRGLSAATYVILLSTEGRGLELSTTENGVIARFEEKKEPTILGIEWVATEVVNGHAEGEWNSGYPFGDPITTNGDVTLHFDSADSVISGFTGCNRFSGTFSALTDGSFTIDPDSMIWTEMWCSSETATQEDAILSLLQGPITYRFWRDGILELHGGENGWTIIGRYYTNEEDGDNDKVEAKKLGEYIEMH